MEDSSILKIKYTKTKWMGPIVLEIIPQTCTQIGEKTVENPHM
jgi:hypothetical protein